MTDRGGLAAFLRRAGIVLRFVFPGRAARAYAGNIRASGMFDRDFYLLSNPRLRRLFRLAPERHYVLFGETAGLCPNAGFSPLAYRFNNPDIGDRPPLLHYIESGRAERRRVLNTDTPDLPALPVPASGDLPDDPAPVAVALHLYYHALWPEFAEALERQAFDFDLYVTATGTEDDIAPLRRAIQERFPSARVWALPNHGRDIFPFLHLLRHGVLAPYAAVCKLHSKQSPHRADGAEWRRALTAAVLGPPERTARRLEAFLTDPSAGLWTAPGQIHEGDAEWGMNRPRAVALLERAGLPAPASPLRFPAGSIWWAKPAVLEKLRALDLGAADFEPEQALVDGTTAHAIERLMGPLTALAGQNILTGPELDP